MARAKVARCTRVLVYAGPQGRTKRVPWNGTGPATQTFRAKGVTWTLVADVREGVV